MKKNSLLTMIAIALLVSVTMQVQAQKGDAKNRFELGAHANFNADNSRLGGTATLKWLMPTTHVDQYRFVITGKASHTPPSDGGFFQAFDKGKYDNISALHLMAGYRMSFFKVPDPSNPQIPKTNLNAFFIGLHTGVSYVHSYDKVGLAFSPEIGYSFKQKWSITAAYQGSYFSGDHKLNLIELGLGYTF